MYVCVCGGGEGGGKAVKRKKSIINGRGGGGGGGQNSLKRCKIIFEQLQKVYTRMHIFSTHLSV